MYNPTETSTFKIEGVQKKQKQSQSVFPKTEFNTPLNHKSIRIKKKFSKFQHYCEPFDSKFNAEKNLTKKPWSTNEHQAKYF